jgi:FkbM family methyltransferase
LAFVRPSDAVVDVGAHIGTFLVPMAKAVGPEGRVLGIEGHLENFELLKENVGLNDLHDRVVLLNQVVSSGDEFVWVESVENTGAHHLVSDIQGERVKSMTLDEICTQYDISPDIIKIDIEGHELKALSNSTQILKGRPVIYIELNDMALRRAGSSIEETREFLSALGYRFFRNTGARNGAHDIFVVRELRDLDEAGTFFDAIAIHEKDPRLEQAICLANRAP